MNQSIPLTQKLYLLGDFENQIFRGTESEEEFHFNSLHTMLFLSTTKL
ncbi:MAG: hypothetical protein FD181_2780 [Prolixibacteraceae bacterium]|nr:MAG: hypothetical protein FD181_2780 [Prolixibacteraceae bacterium]